MNFTRKHNIIVKDDVIFEKGTDGDTYYDENEFATKLKGSDDKLTVLARKKYVDGEISTLKKYVDDENKKQDVKIDKNAADIVDLSGRVTTNENDIGNLQIGYGQLKSDASLLNAWYAKKIKYDTDWVDIDILNGFKLNDNGYFGYKIEMGVLYLSLSNVITKDGLSGIPVVMGKLPTEIGNMLKTNFKAPCGYTKVATPNTADVSIYVLSNTGEIECLSLVTQTVPGIFGCTLSIPLDY